MENGLQLTNKEKKIFTTKGCITVEERKALLNAVEKCDVLLNDIVGQEINLKDYYSEEKTVLDEATGTVKPSFRTILFDTEGKTYATGAYGIHNVIKQIEFVYGPATWEDGVLVKVAKKDIGKGKQSLTLIML